MEIHGILPNPLRLNAPLFCSSCPRDLKLTRSSPVSMLQHGLRPRPASYKSHSLAFIYLPTTMRVNSKPLFTDFRWAKKGRLWKPSWLLSILTAAREARRNLLLLSIPGPATRTPALSYSNSATTRLYVSILRPEVGCWLIINCVPIIR